MASTSTTTYREAANQGLRELFIGQVARTPGAIALESGSETLTYAELYRKAARLAGVLEAYGVGPDALVAIHGDRSLDYLVGVVAAILAGGAYLPLDPQLPPERVAFLLDDARPARDSQPV